MAREGVRGRLVKMEKAGGWGGGRRRRGREGGRGELPGMTVKYVQWMLDSTTCFFGDPTILHS